MTTRMVGSYLTDALERLDGALARTIPRVIDETDPEAIHDMRVAIRRSRTLLRIARPVLGRHHTDVVRRALTKVQRATGDLRDEEVLEETLERVVEDVPELRTWLRGRKRRLRALRREVKALIAAHVLDDARRLLTSLLAFPVAPTKDRPLGKFARRVVRTARRRVEKLRDVDPNDMAGLHELRIAYKNLRYAVEIFAEALPIDDRAVLGPATTFQKRLGDIHDIDVAADVLRRSRLPVDVRRRALAGLASRRARALRKYLHELDPLAPPPDLPEPPLEEDGPPSV